MRRLQLVEFEDAAWLPRVIRDGATDLLDLVFDRFPSASGMARVHALGDPTTTYLSQPVDAMQGGGDLAGVRTMAGALHHFTPRDVAMTANMAVLFVGALLATPLVRPVRAYTPEELLDAAHAVPGVEGYLWNAGVRGRAVFLTGIPRSPRPRAVASSPQPRAR